jgi:hypothetical protein
MANTKTERSTGDSLKKLEPGQFLTVQSIKAGGGSLQARMLSSGDVKFYWRYTDRGANLRAEIGRWDSSAPPLSKVPTAKGFSVKAALEECLVRGKIHVDEKSTGGWPGRKQREAADQDAEKSARQHLVQQTLSDLLDEYCDHLQRQERRSHADARSIFKLHVKAAWPGLAAAPAASLTAIQVTNMLRRLSEDDKGRTANKLRSYLHAAYRCAMDAELDPALPAAFARFKVTSNPVAQSKRIAGADKADKNPLSIQELRKYWKLLSVASGVKGAALRLHLLTGGQRIEQFVKLKGADVHAQHVFLIDPKGRRDEPLIHRVVLTTAAQKEIATLKSIAAAWIVEQGESRNLALPREYLISTDGGGTHVNAMTLTRWAQAIAAEIPGFQLKRVRSGVETALAAARVPMDVRGLLQSHGLTGLQRKHYDGHDYTSELKGALMTLWRELNKDGTRARARKTPGKPPNTTTSRR